MSLDDCHAFNHVLCRTVNCFPRSMEISVRVGENFQLVSKFRDLIVVYF